MNLVPPFVIEMGGAWAFLNASTKEEGFSPLGVYQLPCRPFSSFHFMNYTVCPFGGWPYIFRSTHASLMKSPPRVAPSFATRGQGDEEGGGRSLGGGRRAGGRREEGGVDGLGLTARGCEGGGLVLWETRRRYPPPSAHFVSLGSAWPDLSLVSMPLECVYNEMGDGRGVA